VKVTWTGESVSDELKTSGLISSELAWKEGHSVSTSTKNSPTVSKVSADVDALVKALVSWPTLNVNAYVPTEKLSNPTVYSMSNWEVEFGNSDAGRI